MRNKMEFDRRNLLMMGSAGMLSAMRAGAGSVVHEVAAPGQDPAAQPAHHIKFSVIGLDHNHIMSMTATVIRGGGQLVSFYGTVPAAVAAFQKRYPEAKLARREEGVLHDSSVQLSPAAPIPDYGSPLGISVMH